MTIVQYRYHAIITISTESLILSDNKYFKQALLFKVGSKFNIS